MIKKILKLAFQISESLIILFGLTLVSIIIVSGIGKQSLSFLVGGQSVVDLTALTKGFNLFYLIVTFIVFMIGGFAILFDEIKKAYQQHQGIKSILRIILKH